MIENEHLALMTGLTIGTMMSAGLDVRPETDTAGDYLPTIILTLPEPVYGKRVRLRVELIDE